MLLKTGEVNAPEKTGFGGGNTREELHLNVPLNREARF